MANNPKANPKSNFTLLSKKHNKKVINPAELYVKKNSLRAFLPELLNRK